jgi:hypothetical protein
MNHAVFEKLFVFVSDVVFNPPFGDLMAPQEIAGRNPAYVRQAQLPVFDDWSFSQVGSEDLSEALADLFVGDGLSKGVMVEVKGHNKNRRPTVSAPATRLR